jgi:3-methyl-2-oxobutanoate hydroxymethyltransferase
VNRVRTTDLARRKAQGEKFAVLTAYDSTMARLIGRAGVDVILVGDSVGMVMLGHETTVPVTMADMLHHTRAVSRVVEHALVIADMPFLSYQLGETEALRNAGALLAGGGAAAVKLEGPCLDVIRALVNAGIPVMGHLGLTPQHVHQLGGFGQQARSEDAGRRLVDDAMAIEASGAFSLVLENIPAELAAQVTHRLAIPTVGIGAGPDCDGQVLVTNDLLGLTTGPVPPFVKPYANLGADAVAAMHTFREDVQSGRFHRLLTGKR